MRFERGYAQHVGSRQEQQDAALLLSHEGEQLVVVADGMGGHAGGSIASAQVAETAQRIWAEHRKSPHEPKRLLERIIREGHEAINRAGAEKGLGPRSTCALLHLDGKAAHWAHVGDSRIYRLRDGHLQRLTRDHSVVQMLVDLGKVSEEEMGTHPDQNRLTQSLGGEAQPMPDFGNDGIRPHDAFLVCSDGLWEMIRQDEMAEMLSAARLGDDGARQLAERAFERAKPRSDNISVALVRVDGPPPQSAVSFEEAKTVRSAPARAPAPRSGGGRWGVAAALVVALGVAAAVFYRPWEPARPAMAPPPAETNRKDKPPESTGQGDPRRTEPAKPEEPPKTEPAERRAPAPPPPPPQSVPEAAPPPTAPTPAPETPKPAPEAPKPEPGAQPPAPPSEPAPPAPAPPAERAPPDQPARPAERVPPPAPGEAEKTPSGGGEQRPVAPQGADQNPSGVQPPATPDAQQRR